MQEFTGRSALVRHDRGRLLDRILETPQLAQVVPRLPPELLHRVIERCGLEDCGQFVALATPAQVARVLDLDLWRSPSAGLDEQFDADRFGVWIEVLVDQGADVAARTLAGLDVDLVAAGLAQHVRVFDIATLEGYVTTDGTEIPAVIEPDGGLARDIGGRRFIARRPDAWDAILGVLVELDASHPRAFARLMRACSALSNSRSEVDGLDALLTRTGQAMFDLADEREQRLEARGFASAAPARAFLESSRRFQLDAPAPPVAVRDARGQAPGEAPAWPAHASGPPASDDGTAAVIDLLLEAGLVAGPPRGLLAAGAGRLRLDRIHAHLYAVSERDPAVAAARHEELAMLANVLVAGCSIDARPFTPQEASDAVLATCNLGLECWPGRWRDGGASSADVLVERDLVTVFQVGWTVLHDDVCVPTVSRLLAVLAALPAHDAETQAGLDALRVELARHWRAGRPWRAREALDVLATLDLPVWATLRALIAECPVALSTIGTAGRPRPRRVDPSAFVFISERAQIAAIDEFLDSLPAAFG